MLIDKFITGVEIIRRYDPEADMAVGHDVIFFGRYEIREEMTLDEQQQLEDLGWYEDAEAWAINV